MQLFNEVRIIAANEVREAGEHLFWAREPERELAVSMERYGQLAPLLVRETTEGLDLVAGTARLRVLRDLGQSVCVRMVEAPSSVECAELYMADNQQRALDDGMRLAALRFFSRHLDTDEVADVAYPLLGIRARSKDAKLFAAWLQLPPVWQEFLAAGSVPLAAGSVLARMAGEDLEAVEALFAAYTWSRSNAVNCLTWLFEASKMRDVTVQGVLEEADVPGILAEGLSPKDAIAKMASAIRQVRYPKLAGLQATFADTARNITAGSRWQMTQPNNFETGGSLLSVQVKDAAQLSRAVDELSSMAAAPQWERIWNLGGGDD